MMLSSDWGSTMKRRVGIYLRVSTDGQMTENQRRELEAVAARSYAFLLRSLAGRRAVDSTFAFDLDEV